LKLNKINSVVLIAEFLFSISIQGISRKTGTVTNYFR